tara:strand:+ start:32659 stop:32805 length:147 start_codon:yes stop_codon:yes gene_type:complete
VNKEKYVIQIREKLGKEIDQRQAEKLVSDIYNLCCLIIKSKENGQSIE